MDKVFEVTMRKIFLIPVRSELKIRQLVRLSTLDHHPGVKVIRGFVTSSYR